MKKSLFALFLFTCSFSWGQEINRDSLWKVYNNKSQADTSRLQAMHNIARSYFDKKPDTVIVLANLELKLAQTSGQKKFEAKALNLIGLAFTLKKDSVKPLEYLFRALKLREEINDREGAHQTCRNIERIYVKQGDRAKVLEFWFSQLKKLENKDNKWDIGNCYNDIGNAYMSQYNYPKGLEYYLKSLKVYEDLYAIEGIGSVSKQKIGEDLTAINGIGAASFNIAEVYMNQSNYEKALEYYLKTLKISQQVGSKRGIANSYQGVGLAYFWQSNYPKALEYQFKSAEVYIEISDSGLLAMAYHQVGSTYQGQLNYPKALEYFLKSLKIMRQFNYESGLVEAYSKLCDLYTKLKDYKRAILYGDSALNIIKSQQAIGIESTDILNSMAIAYSKTGRYKEAFEYYFKYKSLSDSMFNGRSSKKINDLVNNFETEKREAEQARLDSIALEHKKQQQLIIYTVGGVLLIVLIFSILLYKRFRLTNKQKQIIEIKSKETEQQKLIIEEKNKDITDSINYAQRIQQAKLPRSEEIKKAFPQSFVLFKPKDIVSGDFYYFTSNNKGVFIASADCTGHGVPGAFMSMIGSERLEDAVSNSHDTSEILKLLNKGIKTSLRQSDSDESTRDGMDIALCSIDTVNRIVKYAGANRPFYLIRKGQMEVEEIKATKKAIGGLTEDDQHFDTHELKLQEGDTFYISTDGYADQFSRDDKKLTTKKFKQILIEIQDKTMPEQEKHLVDFIENWKTGIEQIDDILVIGIRL